MSDLMLLGILRMPMPEVPNPDEVVAYTQFVLTARQAADRIEELERELAEAKRDAERLKWVMEHHVAELGWQGNPRNRALKLTLFFGSLDVSPFLEQETSYDYVLRVEAIDAAMKEAER